MSKLEKEFWPNTRVLRAEIWRNADRLLHREDGPAHVRYWTSGKLRCEEWFQNAEYHRDCGPSHIAHYSSGELECEMYYVNGKRHRTDGPAILWYIKSGAIVLSAWFLHDKEIEPYDWLKENNYKWPLDEYQQTELILRFI